VATAEDLNQLDDFLTRTHHRPYTDAGNAEVFVDMFGSLVRYDHPRKRWLTWDSHRWRQDDIRAVMLMAIQAVRERQRAVIALESDGTARHGAMKKCLEFESRTKLEAMLAIAQAMPPVADAGEGWDETPGLLGVPNGVVDLKTGKLRPGKPEDRITMCTAVEYHPDADCPLWEKFLLDVLEDLETVIYLQRLTGYSLTAEAVLHLLIFLMGTGRNGKGTFFRVVQRILGDYAQLIEVSAFADGRRNAHTTEVTDLELSRFAYCEELGDDYVNAERLKDLSGGGMKTARRIRENTRRFMQTWLLFFSTNGLPKSEDNSWGWWGRVRALDFPNVYTEETADPDLEEKLMAEAKGILAWMVRGAMAFYADGKREGSIPSAVRAKTEQYREDIDKLAPLFEKGYLIECDDEIWTPMVNLKQVYDQYASDQGIVLQFRWSETKLGTLLGQRHRKMRHKVETTEGRKQLVGYHGVAVPDPATGQPLQGWSWNLGDEGRDGDA
jgi:putative DNA primase/helicase